MYFLNTKKRSGRITLQIGVTKVSSVLMFQIYLFIGITKIVFGATRVSLKFTYYTNLHSSLNIFN